MIVGCDRPIKIKTRKLCGPCYGRLYRLGEITPTVREGEHTLTDIDDAAETAVCAECGPTRIRVRQRNGQRKRDCMTVRRRTRGPKQRPPCRGSDAIVALPVDKRERWLRRLYGIGVANYDRMMNDQGGRCAICQSDEQSVLYVDHCHATGRVRGLLCRGCNFAIGMLRDDADAARRAATYLLPNDTAGAE